MNKRHDILFIIILFVFGFFYRLFLSSGAEREIYSDMYRYHELALWVLDGQWAADCCEKNPGYGVFLAGIYKIFGPDNVSALQVSQILLDLLTSVLVYLASKRVFNKKTAIIAFILYLSNPLTAAFGGMRLAENLTFFLTGLIALVTSTPDIYRRLVNWLLYGISLGLLVFVRASFYYFAGIAIIITGWSLAGKFLKKTFFIMLATAGFLLASAYTILANQAKFGMPSPVLPYGAVWRDLYFTFYKDFRWPELKNEAHLSYATNFHPIMTPIYFGYFDTPLEKRREYDLALRDMFVTKFKKEWPLFLTNYTRNIVYIWDKYHLSVIHDPFYPNDELPIRIYNIFLLGTGSIGITRFVKNKRQNLKHPFFLTTAVMFIYISTFFPLVSNESRHSLPFYVLLIPWVAYGLSWIPDRIRFGLRRIP
jgi:4-amino-4-deoxy-L-arabinose transferase-like glycosyltransferase